MSEKNEDINVSPTGVLVGVCCLLLFLGLAAQSIGLDSAHWAAIAGLVAGVFAGNFIWGLSKPIKLSLSIVFVALGGVGVWMTHSAMSAQTDKYMKKLTQEAEQKAKAIVDKRMNQKGVTTLRRSGKLTFNLARIVLMQYGGKGKPAPRIAHSTAELLGTMLLKQTLRGDDLFNTRFLFGVLQKPWPQLSRTLSNDDKIALTQADQALQSLGYKAPPAAIMQPSIPKK